MDGAVHGNLLSGNNVESASCNLSGVEVDDTGTRVLSKLPLVGVHPRVLFTAADYPDIKRRLQYTKFGKIVQKHVSKIAAKITRDYAAFADMDLSNPSLETVENFFRNDEMRNINLPGRLRHNSIFRRARCFTRRRSL